MNKRAFSLLELVLGMALFSMVITTGTAVLLSTLRSSRKAAAIASAKSEGAYALSAMEMMIRFAPIIKCTPPNSLDITRPNDETVTYSLSGTRIASGSAFLTSINVVVTTPCADVFTCTGNTVEICFEIDNAGGVDVTDKAGPGGGIRFQTWVTSRNQYY
jgi:Tfp pilus assembly protein PilW